MDSKTGPNESDKDNRTYGERIKAIKEQVATEGLVDPDEVREVLIGLVTFKGQRQLVLGAEVAVLYSDRDGLDEDITYLQGLLPDDEGQMQFTP